MVEAGALPMLPALWLTYVELAVVTAFALFFSAVSTSSIVGILFTLACVVGRSARFFAVAFVFWLVGPKALPFIDKYFNWLCVVFVVLLVGGFAALKLIGH